MKKIIVASILIASITHAMNEKQQAEPVGKNKPGANGLFESVVGLVASPLVAGAGAAINEQLVKPLAAHEHAVIEQITAITRKCSDEQLAKMKALENQIQQLQKTIENQNKGCCSLQ